jgi:hypothetical protein
MGSKQAVKARGGRGAGQASERLAGEVARGSGGGARRPWNRRGGGGTGKESQDARGGGRGGEIYLMPEGDGAAMRVLLEAAVGARGRLGNAGGRARARREREREGERARRGNQRRRAGGAPDPGTRRVPPQREVVVESSASTLAKKQSPN